MTLQFFAGFIIGTALGVVGVAIITEWVSVRRSARMFRDARAHEARMNAKRAVIVRIK